MRNLFEHILNKHSFLTPKYILNSRDHNEVYTIQNKFRYTICIQKIFLFGISSHAHLIFDIFFTFRKQNICLYKRCDQWSSLVDLRVVFISHARLARVF